jgi:ubiquinone/menaquinone biosynthesis C-methylase UbiE
MDARGPLTPSRQQTANWYDRLSRWYCTIAGRWEAGAREAALEMLLLRPGERVLEIGTGPGQDLPDLLSNTGSQGYVAGLDLSSGMLAQARANIEQSVSQKEGLQARIGLVQADAVCSPFSSGCFDAIYMSFVLELFKAPEIPRVLAECRRLLRDGGRLGLASMNEQDDPNLVYRLYEKAHRSFPNLVDCRPIDVIGYITRAGFTPCLQRQLSVGGLPVLALAAKR